MANSKRLYEESGTKRFFEVHIADDEKRFAKKSSTGFGKILCGCKR
jgi:hypothetical protein